MGRLLKKPKRAGEFSQNADHLFYKMGQRPSDTLSPKENHFTGKVYLLTDATNSSSSWIMADLPQQAHAV